MKKLLPLFFLKKLVFVFMLVLPLLATAAPAFSPKMGQAIGGVIERKSVQRGFAANDPRFDAVISAAAAALTVAATGTVAAAGAPLWVTVGLGALATGVITLAANAAVDWIFNDDGTVTYDAPGGAGNYGQLVQGGDYWSTCSSNQLANAGCFNAATPAGASQARWLDITWGSGKYINWGPPNDTCEIFDSRIAYCWLASNKRGTQITLYRFTNWPYNCDSGYSYSAGRCRSLAEPNSPPPGKKTKKPELAFDDLTTEQKELPVNPKIIADIANQAWQKASSQPGYQGLPYSYNDPITVGDVEAWRASNPSSYPTVGDAVSSAVNPSTGTVPITSPGQGANPTPGIPTAPEGSPQLDLGIDPGIGAPSLENTPTGAQVLAPITGLMPDLRNFQVPSHQGECPKPEFYLDILRTTVRMDAHCTLFEEARGAVYNGSLLAWVLAAILIILSA